MFVNRIQVYPYEGMTRMIDNNDAYTLILQQVFLSLISYELCIEEFGEQTHQTLALASYASFDK